MPYRIDPNTGQPVWDGTSIPQASRDSLAAQIRSLQDQINNLSFIDLDDVPATYTGQSGKIISVKSTEDGLEFITNTGGGGVTDGDKGDITVAGSGATWTIDASAVTEAKIADGAVTANKIGTGAVGPTQLASTAVTAGSYTLANITVDSDGRITAASNGTAGSGTVTTVSVVTANGVSGTVANATTTPAITISLGAITPTSVNGVTITNGGSGALTVSSTASVSGSNTGDVTLNGSGMNYLSRTNQVLTANAIDLSSHVTGDLPLANLAQASAASLLLGRGSASGAGDYQEISLGSGLSMSGTTLSATSGSFDPASPGAIGGTTPSTAVFTQVDVRTDLDVQSTSGAAGPILVWNTGLDLLPNYERGFIRWTSNVFQIGTEFSGSGTAKPIHIQTAGVTRVSIGTSGLIGVNGAATPANTPLSVKAINPGGNHVGVRVENASSTASIVELGGTTSNNGFINIISSAAGTVDLQAGNTQLPGTVGIGRGTGGSLSSARLHVRGSGTTTGLTLLAENSSGTARFTVRDDGAFAFAGGTVAVADTGWTDFTNLTTDKTCDANATTVEELADILGTLIVALKAKGIIAN